MLSPSTATDLGRLSRHALYLEAYANAETRPERRRRALVRMVATLRVIEQCLIERLRAIKA